MKTKMEKKPCKVAGKGPTPIATIWLLIGELSQLCAFMLLIHYLR